ncbi:MAG TPA: zinc ABC transporter substrate-binding protein [Jiangellaceae bacterium]
MTIRRLAVPVTLATALAVASCGSDTDTAQPTEGPTIVAAFYPLAFAAEQVAGDEANVVNLTGTGADAHDLELTAQQVGQIADADLVVYLRGFAPAMDEAIEQNADRTIDVTELIELLPANEDEEHSEDEHSDEDAHADEDEHAHDLDGDPHVWLDPSNMAVIGDTVADELAEVHQEAADAYHDRANEFAGQLAALDEEYTTGLADCARTTFVTSHAAFGYLAEKYGLEMVGIAGIDPEIEPSPSRMAEVQEIVRDEGITTIFYERLVSPAVAESLASDVGVTTAVLDPIESLTDETAGEDYFTLMRANLDALKEANGCA